jgi:hypothetical protein
VLIDDYMPHWDVRSRHRTAVDASQEDTYAAIRTADLAMHPLVRGLLGLRALPSALAAGRMSDLRERASRPITLREFDERGFRVLAESPPDDLLIGLEGAFWQLRGNLRPVSPATFRQPLPPGLARGAWCFTVIPVTATKSILNTETRVLTGGRAALRRFRCYWVFVGGASGLIRRLMLQAIKAEAERSRHYGTS